MPSFSHITTANPSHNNLSLAVRPIFDQGDLLAVDLASGGFITADMRKNFSGDFGRSFTGSRSLIAAYYNKPAKRPRWPGRGSLHIRAAKFDMEGGRMRLRTETGMEFGELASKMTEWPNNLAPALQKALAIHEQTLKGERDEMSGLIIPDDSGMSILGRVVSWIGSSREVERTQSKLEAAAKEKKRVAATSRLLTPKRKFGAVSALTIGVL